MAGQALKGEGYETAAVSPPRNLPSGTSHRHGFYATTRTISVTTSMVGSYNVVCKLKFISNKKRNPTRMEKIEKIEEDREKNRAPYIERQRHLKIKEDACPLRNNEHILCIQ